jgi:hypothetical protein
MNNRNQLIKKFYPRYRKHLEENTLLTFWSELNRCDFRSLDIKDKTKKIMHIKMLLDNHHGNHTKRNHLSPSTTVPDKYKIYNDTLYDVEGVMDYEDHHDSFNQDKFMALKNQLIMYNDKMEPELDFMQQCGNLKNLWPYNALNTYINVLRSLNDRYTLLHSLVNPLAAGACDKIFLNLNDTVAEPDIIGLTRNKYGFNDNILIKIMPWQCFDPNIIDEWKVKYGFSSEIIVLDLNLIIDKPLAIFKIWSRSDLVEVCVKGELNFGVNYMTYYFNQSEFIELIDQKKDKIDKIDLAFSRINLNTE